LTVNDHVVIHCRVEIPRGSRNKYEWDDELGAIKLDRFLYASVVYPTDYGFIPGTCADDGDPLDILVCVSEPTFPGCVIPVKPIAVLKMRDENGQDDKILAVPLRDPNWNEVNELDELPRTLRDEVAHFFAIYKELENKHVELDGWYPRGVALKVIDAAQRRYSSSCSSAFR
jgi:inorganic pyrophosphatase